MHFEAAEHALLVLELHDLDLFQVVQLLRRVVLIYQIIANVIIDLQVAEVGVDLVRRALLDVAENVGERPWDHTAVALGAAASNGEGFARAGLTVREYRSVVALEAAIDHILGDCFEYGLLPRGRVENTVEAEPALV